MPSPWSSCQCQSELSAQVTLNPTPCHPHRKNTHLEKKKTIQTVKDNVTPSFRQTHDALSKHNLKPPNLTGCMREMWVYSRSLTDLLHLEWWSQVLQPAGISSPGSEEGHGCCPQSHQNTCGHTALFHLSGSSKYSLGGHTPHTASH